MRKTLSLFLAVSSFLLVLVAFGCNGANPPNVSIALNSSASETIAEGTTTTISASLTNDRWQQGVNWSMTGAGSLSDQRVTSVIYHAPATVSSTAKATITATSASNPASTAQIVITVRHAPKVSTTSLPEATVATSYSATLEATSGTGAYTWSVSSGSLPAWASLDAGTGVISGMPNASGTTNFSVIASDEAKLASAPQELSLAVNPGPALEISTQALPGGVVSVPYSFTLEASGGLAPYTWSVSSGSLPSWAKLDSSSGEFSGTPDAEGTSNFSVQVKDSQATPAVASLALTLVIKASSSANNFELHGQYAFLLQGFDDKTGNQFAIVGSFIADGNGKITSGLEDINGPDGYQPALTFTGTYNVGLDNRGRATITNSAGKSTTFAFAVGGLDKNNVATSGSLIEFDDTDGKTGRRGTGSLYLQNPNNFNLASIEGPYAFQMVGQEGVGSRAVITGVFRADAKGGLTNGDEFYYSSTSTNGSHITFAGTFATGTNTNSFGRMTLQVLADGDTSHTVVYIINGGHALGMTAGSGDGSSDVGVASGEVLAQASGPFSNASLNGTSVLYNVGLGSSASHSEVDLGVMTSDGQGTAVAVIGDGNDGGQPPETTGPMTVSYSVAANGRMEDANTGEVFGYLVDKNEGFIMPSARRAQAIFFEPQTGGPFSNASLSGNYVFGIVGAAVTGSGVASGVMSSAGDGKLSFTIDSSHPTDLLIAGQTGTFELTIDANGRAVYPEGHVVFYVVSPKKVVFFNTHSMWPTIGILQDTVNPAPNVLTSVVHPAAVGTAYSVALHASDGTGAYTWSVSSGALPAWAQLDPASGIISGTPNATGTANFSVTVTDSAGLSSAPQDLSIVTSAPAALAVSTTSLPEGEVGVAYSAKLVASGGIQPYTWTVSGGSLPSWAILSSSTGTISGTPKAAGTTTFSVIATDDAGTTSAAQALTLSVKAGKVAITTTTLPNGLVWVAYTAFIPVSGGVPPYTWSITGGTPPAWAQMDPSSGKISGLPNTTGTWNFTVKVADSEATPAVATAPLSLTVEGQDGTNTAELKGQYAFLLQGFDDATGQQFAVIGSFIADGNGLITGGLEDSNGPDGYHAAVPFTGHYSVGADNRGYGNFSSPSGFSFRFAFVVGGLNSGNVATSGSMIEFDDTTGYMGRRGSGSFYLQNPTAFKLASFDGPYAFQMSAQPFPPSSRIVFTGAFIADGQGNMTSGDEQIITGPDGKSLRDTFTGTIFTTASTSQFGRVTWQESHSGGGPTNLVSYIVGSGHALVMGSGSLGGEVLAQSSTSFSAASLNGTFVSYSTGLGYIPGHSDAYLTLMTANGAGGGTFSQDMNDSGNIVTKTGSLKYLVSPNGRVEIVDPTSGQTAAVAYLVDKNKGFSMNIDPDAAAGFFEPQDSGPFSNASISGSYAFGTAAPVAATQPVTSGVATSSGDGKLNEASDVSFPFGLLLPGLNAQFSITVDSSGRVTNVQGPEVWYLVSPNKFIGILPSGMDPGIVIFYKTKP